MNPWSEPRLSERDRAEIDEMRRQADEAEAQALELLGEPAPLRRHRSALSFYNGVSSAALAAKRQTAAYLKLRKSRDAPVADASRRAAPEAAEAAPNSAEAARESAEAAHCAEVMGKSAEANRSSAEANRPSAEAARPSPRNSYEAAVRRREADRAAARREVRIVS